MVIKLGGSTLEGLNKDFLLILKSYKIAVWSLLLLMAVAQLLIVN